MPKYEDMTIEELIDEREAITHERHPRNPRWQEQANVPFLVEGEWIIFRRVQDCATDLERLETVLFDKLKRSSDWERA